MFVFQGSYSDLYPDSDDSSEEQIENSKNTWSCKVQTPPLTLSLKIICCYCVFTHELGNYTNLNTNFMGFGKTIMRFVVVNLYVGVHVLCIVCI